ncbi:putative gustatory receptor 98b [Bactrocera neohumeralis]|uniref:putative gustatory receptor 98b n=1 Tax=Bactrocera neohumeralis TaxID=98809 RepID=UPI00216547D8|nr:putative gustatory receptor 98b [Bactrocera neohumeralis]
MRPVKFTESALLTVITPYLWTLSLFAVVMPPILILRRTPSDRLWLFHLFRFIFVVYTLLQLSVGFSIEHIKNIVISRYVWENSVDDMTRILTIGINLMQIMVQIVLYTQALTGHQQLRSIFTKVAQIESDIRKHLTTVCSLCAVRWRFCLRIGIWWLVVCVFLLQLNYALSDHNLAPRFRWINVVFSMLSQIKVVEYCVCVLLIQELLHLVYQQLVHLRRELVLCESVDLRWSLYVELQTNQQLLARIWQLLSEVERYFCIPMSLVFFYHGFTITQTILWGYTNLEQEDFNLRLYRTAIAIMIIASLFIPCYLSQCCIDEYNRFGTLLHKLKTVGIDVNLSMRLQEYSFQLMHQQMLFTCGGLFDINLKNFGTIILTITIYVIIFIQFKLQAVKERKIQQGTSFV